MRNLILPFCSCLLMLAFPLLSHAQVTGQYPLMTINKNNGYEVGVGKLPVEDGNTIGRLQIRGWVTDGYYHPGSQIKSTVTGAVNADGFPANLQFFTGYPDLLPRMTITDEGRVGIGTPLPDFDLHTVGNTHTTGDFFGRIHFDDNQSTDDAPDSYVDEAYFELKQRSVLNLPAGLGTHGGLLSLAPGNTSYDHQLFFAEDGVFTRRWDGGAPSWAGSTWYKMLTSEDINGTPNRIAKFTGPSSLGDSQLWDDGSQVGIGTDSPAAGYLLDINGDTRTNGNHLVAGDQEVDGNTTLNSELTVLGNTLLSADAEVTGMLSAMSDADVAGELNVAGDANVGGNLDVAGTTHLDGTVSIATTSTPGGHELYVGGSIIAEEVVVKLETNWPDYVFSDDYPQPDIREWAQFIKTHKHLPGMPSAAEMAQRDGLALGEHQRLLLEKVEELTLILIEQQKEIDALKAKLDKEQD